MAYQSRPTISGVLDLHNKLIFCHYSRTNTEKSFPLFELANFYRCSYVVLFFFSLAYCNLPFHFLRFFQQHKDLGKWQVKKIIMLQKHDFQCVSTLPNKFYISLSSNSLMTGLLFPDRVTKNSALSLLISADIRCDAAAAFLTLKKYLAWTSFIK